MSGPNPHLSATPKTEAEFRAQADLQRSIARGYGAPDSQKGKTRAKGGNPKLRDAALARAKAYDAKADALTLKRTESGAG